MNLPAAAETTDLRQQFAIGDNDNQLIWELVANITPASDVLARFGLTADGFKAKCRNRMFASAYREAKRLWDSDMNAQERIKLKARFLLEDTLPRIHKIATNVEISPNASLDAARLLGDFAEAGTKKPAATQTEKANVSININLGTRPGEKVVINGEAVPVEARDE